MKKIGLYLDSVIGGGVYQYNLSILNAFISLSKNRINSVIAYSNTDWNKFFKNSQTDDVKRIPYSIPSKLWMHNNYHLLFWRKTSPMFDNFSRQFINENCDLWIFPSQDIWGYSLPINSMVTIHDLMHRYEKSFVEAASNHMFKKRERHYSRISEYSKAILVDSKIGKKQMLESYNTNPQKIHILPYIPPKYIFKNSKNINIHQIYNLPKKYFFYPAQFWSHKNHLSLLEAAAKIKNQYPDISFVFVGSKKNAYESVINYINKHSLSNYIKILDYVPNQHMSELYKSARAMIMPTFFGPTNIPPLEAMALGCPVAVSKIYAMPEQVGEAGLVFDPNSIDEIINIMIKLWTNDKLIDNLREKGYEKSKFWQQSQFNVKFKNIVNQVLDIN